LLCRSDPQARAPPNRSPARMRHVVFHVGKGIEMPLNDLNGRLVNTAS
jgi:hypothetical protein